MATSAAIDTRYVDPDEPSFRERSDHLANQITELSGYLYAGTYQLLEMIRQFDEDKLWELDGICSCAHWLNWKCGTGMNAAREKVRVANALAGLPKISASFERGEISYSKVRAMTRVATADNEDYLLMIAHHGTAHHVETLVRKYRRARKLQDLQEAGRQHNERSFQVYYEADGSISVHLRLPPEKGALLLKSVERAVAEADAAFGEEAPDVSAETPVARVEREPLDRRKADAVADIAESYLANGHSASSSADRYQVMLHVSAETLNNGGGDISHLEDDQRVSAETARRICCDAGISVLSKDGDGNLLNIGRKTRVIPPAMRRALQARDGNCRFPGCTHRYFIDGHHIRHWSDGGETSLDNLVLLCRHHHRLVHEGGFGCHRTADGKIRFDGADGRPIPDAGRLPPLRQPIELGKHLQARREDLYVDASTCVTRFDDPRIDWNLAVGALFT
jgi:hypothetical protein